MAVPTKKVQRFPKKSTTKKPIANLGKNQLHLSYTQTCGFTIRRAFRLITFCESRQWLLRRIFTELSSFRSRRHRRQIYDNFIITRIFLLSSLDRLIFRKRRKPRRGLSFRRRSDGDFSRWERSQDRPMPFHGADTEYCDPRCTSH